MQVGVSCRYLLVYGSGNSYEVVEPMAKERVKRKLSAILCADVVGYSRLMGEDETATLNELNTCDTEIIEPTVNEHNGRIFKRLGDGFLVEFSSAVDSVECALAWQKHIEEKKFPLQFRIGINLGDVIVQDDDVYGDCWILFR